MLPKSLSSPTSISTNVASTSPTHSLFSTPLGLEPRSESSGSHPPLTISVLPASPRPTVQQSNSNKKKETDHSLTPDINKRKNRKLFGLSWPPPVTTTSSIYKNVKRTSSDALSSLCIQDTTNYSKSVLTPDYGPTNDTHPEHVTLSNAFIPKPERSAGRNKTLTLPLPYWRHRRNSSSSSADGCESTSSLSVPRSSDRKSCSSSTSGSPDEKTFTHHTVSTTTQQPDSTVFYQRHRPYRRRCQTGPAAPGMLQSQLEAAKICAESQTVTSVGIGLGLSSGSDTNLNSMQHFLNKTFDSNYKRVPKRFGRSRAFTDTTEKNYHRMTTSAKQRQKWINVLKSMFEDLAEQSDKKQKTIDKEIFLKYFPLPGVLGERLFDLFDIDGSQTIDFYEFLRGLAVIYNGTPEEKKKFLFDMYDLDGNGRITREELSALLSHIPAAFKALHTLTLPNETDWNDDDYTHLDQDFSQETKKNDLSSHSMKNHVYFTPEYPIRGVNRLRRRSQSEKFRNARHRHTLRHSVGSLEEHVASIVHTVFSGLSKDTYDERKRRRCIVNSASDDGLTFTEFCNALEKSTEILEVLNLFYDVGMPDLPIPQEALILNPFKTSSLFCGPKPDFSLDIHRVRFSSLKLPSFMSPRHIMTTGNPLGEVPQYSSILPTTQLQSPPPSVPHNDDMESRNKQEFKSISTEFFSDSNNCSPELIPTGMDYYARSSIQHHSIPDTDLFDSTGCGQYSNSSDNNYSYQCDSSPELREGILRCSATRLSDSSNYKETERRESSSVLTPSIIPPTMSTETPESDDLVVSGWLYKVGRRFNLKHHRFFVLRDRFLYYFTTTKNLAPKKALFIQGATVSIICNTERKPIFAFDICLPNGRHHRLYAQNSRDRDLWVHALRLASRTASFHDDYLIQTQLGKGKFAVVYQGLNKLTRKPVAIKIIVKKELEKSNRSFLRTEVAVMRLLHHPNIVRLIDVYDTTNYLYLVMECTRHGDVGRLSYLLETHLTHPCYCMCWSPLGHKQMKKSVSYDVVSESIQPSDTLPSDNKGIMITTQLVSERLALLVSRGVLLGLACLHHHNIVHRDLKPENILMTSLEQISSPISVTHNSNTTMKQDHMPLLGTYPHDDSFIDPELYKRKDTLDLNGHLEQEYSQNDSTFIYSELNKHLLNTNSQNITSHCMSNSKEDHLQSNNQEFLRNNSVDKSTYLCPCSQCFICTTLKNIADVQLTDFGLSKILGPTDQAKESLGTLNYAAPEVILGEPYGRKVDLWALGVITYQILSGGRLLPFDRPSETLVAQAVINSHFSFEPSNYWDTIPLSAKNFITSLLRYNPLLRPSAIKALTHPWLQERFPSLVGTASDYFHSNDEMNIST